MKKFHSKKILIFSIYPTQEGKSGGQKRVDALIRYYQDNGFQTKHIGVFNALFYPQHSNGDLPFWGTLAKESIYKPHYEVFISARAYNDDPKVKRKVIKSIKNFLPDIIQIENAFPYIGLKKILMEIDFKGKLIYSSHNIEYKMKEEMFEQIGYAKEEYKASIEEIKKNECELTQKAHLTLSVTSSDMNMLKKIGAKNVLLCPNGVSELVPKPKERDYWKKTFQKKGIRKIALFIAGFHIPNWYGFYKMVGLGLGFMPEDTCIVIAGTISSFFQEQVEKFKYDITATTFKKRAFITGKLSEDRLHGLIDFADTILLPIVSGGGSNLKTAEALISHKKIVATHFAFRGFEHLKNMNHILIHDKPLEFRKAILKSLTLPSINGSQQEKKRIETVLWKNCFKGLAEKIHKL